MANIDFSPLAETLAAQEPLALGYDQNPSSLLLLCGMEPARSSLFNPQRRFVTVLVEQMFGVFGAVMKDSISVAHVRHRLHGRSGGFCQTNPSGSVSRTARKGQMQSARKLPN